MATIVTRASIYFDYETVAEYVLTIDALDPYAATGRATVSIVLNDLEEIELPVNQAPHLASTIFFVDENVGDEFTPAQTVIGSAITADDPDNRIDEITYQIVGDSEQFELVVAAGMATIVTRTSIHFDYETVAEYVLTIDALDPHAATGRATVSIVLNDLEEIELPVNQAPYLASTVFFVDENVGDEFTPAQTVIGSALSADDPDNRIDEITYQIVGDSEQFELVVAAGMATIVTRTSIYFDYETVAEYVLTIDALDPYAATGRATVSIVLNDLEEIELPANQAPYLASTIFFVDENVGDEFTPAQTVIGSALAADDPDNSELTR